MQKLYTYYPEAKNFQIDTFEELKANLGYLTKDELSIVEKAYEKAEKLHRNSPPRVATGKPYITHPLSVANTAALYHANYKIICAALLHDTVEDTDYTIEELAEDFGNDIAEIVDTVTKISTAKDGIKDKETARVATYRKILENVSKYGINGIYGIMLKLLDRVDNIQTLDGFSEGKRFRIASETMHIYVPLARISGVYDAKDFLENASLMNMNPEKFDEYYEKRKQIMDSVEDLCSEFCSLAADLLLEQNVSLDYEIKLKNLYGIYKQIEERGKTLEQISDLVGIKLIVPTKGDCYTTFGAVHELGEPLKGGVNDYISKPKPNGYMSLNTSIKYKNTKIQARIRSEKMHRCNRLGLLNGDNPATGKIISSIKSNVESINRNNPTDKEFVVAAEKKFLRPTITIQSPTGKRIQIHDGDTALDYALEANLVANQNEIDRIYVNGRKLENFNELLSDEDYVYVLRKEN